jgi:hypothetical protein
VALHVRANIGTVTAAVFDRRLHGITPGGSDFDPPTHPPATKLVVSGFIPGPGPRLLQLANPGASDATVTLHLATRGANFEPAGVHTVVVRAAQTLAVNLTAAFGGDGGGVVVTSDLPVLAAGLSQVDASRKLPETAWLPAGQPLTAPAVLASNDPLFGQAVDLVVTAPADAGRLAVKNVSGVTRLVSVPAGRSVVVDLRVLFGTGSRSPGPLLLVPLDRAGLVATRVVYALGAHGVLVTALAPAPVPPPVALPGARYDPRAALR